MIFKKEYPRSGWMDGLLLAEHLVKGGYSMGSVNDNPLWWRDDSGNIKWYWNTDEFSEGMKDYWEYLNKST